MGLVEDTERMNLGTGGRSRPLFSAVCAAAVAKGTTSLSNSALLFRLAHFPRLRVLRESAEGV